MLYVARIVMQINNSISMSENKSTLQSICINEARFKYRITDIKYKIWNTEMIWYVYWKKKESYELQNNF